jgi:hypothetical protein
MAALALAIEMFVLMMAVWENRGVAGERGLDSLSCVLAMLQAVFGVSCDGVLFVLK